MGDLGNFGWGETRGDGGTGVRIKSFLCTDGDLDRVLIDRSDCGRGGSGDGGGPGDSERNVMDRIELGREDAALPVVAVEERRLGLALTNLEADALR